MKVKIVSIKKKLIQLLNVVLTILIILFYLINLTDLLKVISELFHYNKLFGLINTFYRAIDYEKVANSLGFDHGFMPFLSWHNFQVWAISLLGAFIIIHPVTYFIPNKGLKSEPVSSGSKHSFINSNINIIDKFTSLNSPDIESKIGHLLYGIPKNIAESILLSTAKAVEQNNKLDIPKTIIKYRIDAISFIHKSLEKTTGKILGFMNIMCKIILIGISISIFLNLFKTNQLANSYIYCYLFITSLFITMIIKRFEKEGKYGLCKKIIPKNFLRKYLKRHPGMSKILEILLVGPHLDVYYAKEQAIIDLYSYPRKTFNFVIEDLKYDDILNSIKDTNEYLRADR